MRRFAFYVFGVLVSLPLWVLAGPLLQPAPTLIASGGGSSSSGGVTGSGAAGQCAFWTSASAISGDSGCTYDSATDSLTLAGGLTVDTNTLFVARTTDRIGVGTLAPYNRVTVTGNGYQAVDLWAYGSEAGYVFTRSGGTTASPTAITSGQHILSLDAFGQYDTSALTRSPGARLRAVPTENWGSSNTGTEWQFFTKANGATAASNPVPNVTLGANYTFANLTSCSAGIQTNGSGVMSCLPSDEKLKTFVAEKVPGLDAVLKLRPRAYRWAQASIQADGDETVHFGFGAQQVAAVMPQAVKDSRHAKILEDRAIVAALVVAVQELSAKVTSLEERENADH